MIGKMLTYKRVEFLGENKNSFKEKKILLRRFFNV